MLNITNNDTTVQVRVDHETKDQANQTLNKLGLTMAEAVRIFLRQVVMQKGLPFRVHIPNEMTLKTLEEAKKGKNMNEAENVEELFEELNN